MQGGQTRKIRVFRCGRSTGRWFGRLRRRDRSGRINLGGVPRLETGRFVRAGKNLTLNERLVLLLCARRVKLSGG